MTREGTHTQLSIEFAAKREVNPHDVADAIYDDFESRTCENCKQIDCPMFLEAVNYDVIKEKKDFGCNKFSCKGEEDELLKIM